MYHYFLRLLLLCFAVPAIHCMRIVVSVDGEQQEVVFGQQRDQAAAQKAEAERKGELQQKNMALALLKKEAAAGEAPITPQEMLALAAIYRDGKFVAANKEKMFQWLTAAAEQTEVFHVQARAWYSLGLQYAQLKDSEKARHFFTRSAFQENDLAARGWSWFHLSTLVDNPLDKQTYLEMAAEQKLDEKLRVQASNCLGTLFFNQEPRNIEKARKWCDQETFLALLVIHNEVEELRSFLQKNPHLPLTINNLLKTTPYNLATVMRWHEPIQELTVTALSALHLAALHGHAECATILLDAGANVDTRDAIGATPLHYACAKGSIDMVKLLRSREKKADATCSLKSRTHSWDAVDSAIRAKHSEVVEYLLLDAVDATDEYYTTVLQYCQDRPSLVALCLSYGAHLPESGIPEEMLTQARALAEPDMQFKRLLDAGDAEGLGEFFKHNRIHGINHAYEYPSQAMPCFAIHQDHHAHAMPPLHMAAQRGQLEVVRVLLEQKARLKEVDGMGATALHWACASGRLDVATFLVEQGAPTNKKLAHNCDPHRWTPLEVAAECGQDGVAKFLLSREEHNADFYQNFLQHCAKSRSLVARCLSQGAQPVDLHRDETGRKAIRWALSEEAPTFGLLKEAYAYNQLIQGSREAYNRIFTLLCFFRKLNYEGMTIREAEGGNPACIARHSIPRDVQWLIICKHFGRDLLKAAAYVKKQVGDTAPSYRELIDIIYKRASKHFKPSDILAVCTTDIL